ncbi:MAG: porin family protein [Endomicrobia bacterium]|nr:porin family protein [Endomicrobiia bacterium]
MKKLVLAALAVALMAGSVFSEGREMKIKLGLETMGAAGFNYDGNRGIDIDSDIGLGMALEFLFPVSNIVKIGPAIGYSFARYLKLSDSMQAVTNINKQSLSFVPIYATIEVNPIKSAAEVFLKGNIGVNYGTVSVEGTIPAFGPFPAYPYKTSDYHLGFYYGLGAGYNFPFGLFLDALYSWNIMYEVGGSITYSKLTISAGYRFGI